MRVGLTGGIASGKSAASAILAELGAVIIDYDVLAREVVQPGTEGLQAIVKRFGIGVLDEQEHLNRPALAEIVFADPLALSDLEAITHPLIKKRAIERESQAPAGSIVVHDNPLLVEMGGVDLVDAVIVIDVPEEVQIQRLTQLRNMSEDQARERIAAQTSREKRTGVANYVVDNTGSLEELAMKLQEIWKELRSQI